MSMYFVFCHLNIHWRNRQTEKKEMNNNLSQSLQSLQRSAVMLQKEQFAVNFN